MEWQTFTRELRLTPDQEPAVRDLVERAKDRFAEVCQRPAAGPGPSPLQVIVTELQRLPRPAEEEVAARFFRYLTEGKDAGGRRFAGGRGGGGGGAPRGPRGP